MSTASARAIVAELEAALRAVATAERAEREKAYLKSQIAHIGARLPDIRAAVRGLRARHPRLTRAELIAVVEELWRRKVHELRAAAVQLLDTHGALLEPADLALVERLLRDSRTWALVDELAVAVAGRLVERHPEQAAVLDRWAGDDDFWIRRAAMLALLRPLRRGGGDFDRFAGYADGMLEEKEFFIRKAIGWILREVGRKRPELVVRWLGGSSAERLGTHLVPGAKARSEASRGAGLAPRAARAAGLTVREAVKHLPEAARREILARRER